MRNTILRILCAIYVTLYLAANIMSVRVIHWHGISWFDAGTLVFPLTYFLSELVTELYGRKVAQTLAFTTIGCQILFTFFTWLATMMPYPPQMAGLAQSYSDVLTFVPRITTASLVAFLIGQMTNIHIMAGIKEHFGGPIWVRTLTSSIVGYLIDAITFITIAFHGTIPFHQLFQMIGIQVSFSVLIEAFFSTPMTYWTVNAIHRYEVRSKN